MAKKKTLLEQAKATQAVSTTLWFRSLTPEQQTEVLDLRSAYRSGELVATVSALHRLVKQEMGYPCGYQGFKGWLTDG